MKIKTRNFLQSAAVTAALMLLAATAHATDLYWGGGTTDITNGTALPTTTTGINLQGTWDTTTKNWSNNATSTVYQAWTTSVNDVSLGLVAAGAGTAASQTLSLANGSNFTFTGRMYGGIFGGSYGQVFELKPVSGSATVTLGGSSVVFDITETVNNGTRGLQFDSGVSLAGSANMIVRGGSIINVRSDSSAYTGAVRLENGILKIDNYSGPTANMRGVTSFDIHNVNLGLGNMTYASMNGNPTELQLSYNTGLNAIGSTANITLSNGAMGFTGIRSATPTIQNAGSLTLNTAGRLNLGSVNGTAGSGLDAQLNFNGGLIRSSGTATSARDTLLVGVNATGTLAGNTAAVTFANGSATYGNNLLPWASTSNAEFLNINTSNVLTVVASTQAATDLSSWATTYSSGTDNVRVGNNTAFTPTNSIANTTVNSLGLYTNAATTLTIASGNTLTIASGGLAYASTVAGIITGGSITTASNNPLYISVGGGGLQIASPITGNIDVVKSGNATLVFNASSANTYTGTTYVNGGTINLNTGQLTIPGALVINNGGTVQFKVAGQIAANSAITINEGGFFTIGNGQTFTTSGLITINNGQLYASNANATAIAANGGLAFNGGFLTIGAEATRSVALGGNVSYSSSATTAAVFEQNGGTWAGLAVNASLSLGTAARTFNIADSSTMSEATPEMTIGLSITSGTGGALVKTGDGVLRLTGGAGFTGSTYSGQNTYTGGTTINAGTLSVGFVSNIGVTANATATGTATGTMVFFAAPVNLIVGQKLTGSDNFVARIISPTQVLMTSSTGLTTTGALTSYSFDATVAQSGSLLGTNTVTINGGTSGDAPTLLADSGVTTANAITVGNTGTSRTIGSSSTSGTATYTGNMTLNGGVILSAAAGGTVAFSTGAIGGTGGVTKSGAGTVTLAGNNAYSGGTTITAGTLVLASNTAAGTTGIAIGASSATLQINSGITIANNITLSNANAAVTRQVAGGSSYTVGTSGNLTSSFGGTNTIAKILAGTNSVGTTDTITMSFRNTATATNDAIRMSDVFTLSGVTNIGGSQTDQFVLQLNASTVTSSSFIGWLSGGSWVNAISGNTGGTPNFVLGAYTNQGLGSYGVDVTNHNVWAVLNHNSDFAVVPEPATWALLAFSLTTVMVLRRCRS